MVCVQEGLPVLSRGHRGATRGSGFVEAATNFVGAWILTVARRQDRGSDAEVTMPNVTNPDSAPDSTIAECRNPAQCSRIDNSKCSKSDNSANCHNPDSPKCIQKPLHLPLHLELSLFATVR